MRLCVTSQKFFLRSALLRCQTTFHLGALQTADDDSGGPLGIRPHASLRNDSLFVVIHAGFTKVD